jgi:hypothetical protein
MDEALQRKLETSSSKHLEVGNCSRCKEIYREFTWKNCEHFGAGGDFDNRTANEEITRQEDHLQLREYSPEESDGIKGVHLSTHRHFVPYNTNANIKHLLKKNIPSIPLFPIFFDLEAVDKMKEHAIHAFHEIHKQFNEPNLEIYLSHGSSGRPSIAVMEGYSHFIRSFKLDWRLYNLTRDEHYDSNEKNEGYQMTPGSSNYWQQESAKQKEEITRLGSELEKVSTLLSDTASALSAESIRLKSRLDKKVEED